MDVAVLLTLFSYHAHLKLLYKTGLLSLYTTTIKYF